MLLIKTTKQFRLLKKTIHAREKRLYKIQADEKKVTCFLTMITELQTMRLIVIIILLILLNYKYKQRCFDYDYN